MKNILFIFTVALISLPSISLAEIEGEKDSCNIYIDPEMKEICLGNFNPMAEKLLTLAKETEEKFAHIEDPSKSDFASCSYLQKALTYYSALETIFFKYDVNKTVASSNIEDVADSKKRVEKKLIDFCK